MRPLRALALLSALVPCPAQRPDVPAAASTPERQALRLVRQLELPARCSTAWRELVAVGAPAALPLAAATADPRPEVAMRAFWVLGLLRADGAAALPRLREIAAGRDARLAGAAAWAIARIEFRGRLLADFNGGKVVHVDDKDQTVRTIEGLQGPWAVEPVGNGRLLVSEYSGDCVRELDADGKEVWKRDELDDPYHAQRLPDGNTVICDAGHNQVIEVDREGKVVWERKDLKRPVAAVRTPDGHTLLVEQEGFVSELDEQGVELWRLSGLEQPMRAERMLNGNVLIALHNGNKVIELVAPAAEPLQVIEMPTAQVALRRRDGHTLIAATSCFVEFDAAGREVWRRRAEYGVGVFW